MKIDDCENIGKKGKKKIHIRFGGFFQTVHKNFGQRVCDMEVNLVSLIICF
jgi:hypothetical protein